MAKITPSWWQEADTILPSERSDFDVDDTTKSILDKNPIAGTMATFEEVMERLVCDEILRKSVNNNRENSLRFVPDEIRAAVAKVLFAMKNPYLVHDEPQPEMRFVAPTTRVRELNEKTDVSVGKITDSGAIKLPPRVSLSGDTQEVSPDAFAKFLEEQRKKKEAEGNAQ